MLQHIILSSGDTALVVNNVFVMTSDPDFESTHDLETVAENLAGALELSLQRIERQVPAQADWDWDDVLEEINSDGAHASDTPRS